jgi:hypothetical protein
MTKYNDKIKALKDKMSSTKDSIERNILMIEVLRLHERKLQGMGVSKFK